MTISKRDLKLVFILCGLLIFIGVYVGVYTKFDSKTVQLQADIADLQLRLEQLQGYYENLSFYEDGIASSRKEIEKKLDEYPNDVRAEDGIMYADKLEKEVGITISSAVFSEPEAIMELRGVLENEDGSYQVTNFNAVYTAIDYTCTLNYQQLKNMIYYVNHTKNLTKLNNVSISYDATTGELAGNVAVDKYFIRGADANYYPTEVPSMRMGTKNIFGTVTTNTAPANGAVTTTPTTGAAATAN